MLTVLGLDIGTTTISAVAVNAENGEILSACNLPNSAQTESPYSRSTQDPDIILETVLQLKTQMIEKYGKFSVIGVTGQMHGILYLDSNLKPLGPLYTWQDRGGDLPYKESTYAEYLSSLTGFPLASGYGIVTDYVNRSLGLRPSNTAFICTIHDWVAAKLAGTKKPIMHTSDAASLGCFSIENNCFDKEALEKIGLDIQLLPCVTADFTIIGNTSEGTPVTVAIGDNQASVIGSITGDTCALANIGTGSQISVPSDVKTYIKGIDIRPLIDDRLLLVGAPLCGGRSFALLNSFYGECIKAFGLNCDNIYYFMDKMAEEAPQETTLLVDTRFCGTREDPSLRGSISNIGLDNFTPAQLTRGFLKGMATELYELFCLMKPTLSSEINQLIGSGNAIRKSHVLQSYLSEIFGMPIKIPAHKEEAAFGAAVSAAFAIGIYSSLSEAQTVMIHYL